MEKSRKKLIISVEEIKGTCPVYKVGDKIVLDEGYQINLEATDSICMHSLASIMPYYVALSCGIDPRSIGLQRQDAKGDCAYVQCLDPCERTGGGTVVFAIRRS